MKVKDCPEGIKSEIKKIVKRQGYRKWKEVKLLDLDSSFILQDTMEGSMFWIKLSELLN